MSSSRTERVWNRRQVLAMGCALGGTLSLSRSSPAVSPRVDDGVYSPFKLGLQSYSLRGLKEGGRADLQKALLATRELGLHFWEAYPAHFPRSENAADIKHCQDLMAAQGVTLAGYGVVPLGKDAAADSRMFEFAKALGVPYLSADPDPAPASLDAIDKLIEKYDIAVGIHNHGPGHRYAKIDTLASIIKDHHPKFGVCIDTGHFLRSREDPVDAVAAFGNRVYGVHLKDVKNAETFTILGQGDLRTLDLLKALAKNKYSYLVAIEYEESEDNPIADIKACLAAVSKTISEVRGA